MEAHEKDLRQSQWSLVAWQWVTISSVTVGHDWQLVATGQKLVIQVGVLMVLGQGSFCLFNNVDVALIV